MASDLLLRIAPKPGADGHTVGGTGPSTLKDSAQFPASPPPPHLTSGAYVKAYDEVKPSEPFDSTRTQAQTDIATFYNDNSIV